MHGQSDGIWEKIVFASMQLILPSISTDGKGPVAGGNCNNSWQKYFVNDSMTDVIHVIKKWFWSGQFLYSSQVPRDYTFTILQIVMKDTA